MTVQCPWCNWHDTWGMDDGSAEESLCNHKSQCSKNPDKIKMTPSLKDRIILAKLAGLKQDTSGKWKDGTWLKPDKDIGWMPCGQLSEMFATIDSIREVVMMQSPEWQREFDAYLVCDSPRSSEVRYLHELTPDDWASAAVETAEKMKK